MINCVFVGAGGFIGAVLRYLCGMIPLTEKSQFPIITMLINITGAFLIGLISAAAARWGLLDSKIILFFKTGICGGFTTFSTFSLESFQLIENGKIGYSVVYMTLSVLLCLAAVLAGTYVFQSILGK